MMKKLTALLMAAMMLMSCAAGFASEEKGITFENMFLSTIMLEDHHIRDYEDLRALSAGDVYLEGQIWALIAQDKESDFSGEAEGCYIGCSGPNNYYLYSMKNGDNVMVVQYDLATQLCTVWIYDVPFAEAKVTFAEHFSEMYIVTAEEFEAKVAGWVNLMGIVSATAEELQ